MIQIYIDGLMMWLWSIHCNYGDIISYSNSRSMTYTMTNTYWQKFLQARWILKFIFFTLHAFKFIFQDLSNRNYKNINNSFNYIFGYMLIKLLWMWSWRRWKKIVELGELSSGRRKRCLSASQKYKVKGDPRERSHRERTRNRDLNKKG